MNHLLNAPFNTEIEAPFSILEPSLHGDIIIFCDHVSVMSHG